MNCKARFVHGAYFWGVMVCYICVRCWMTQCWSCFISRLFTLHLFPHPLLLFVVVVVSATKPNPSIPKSRLPIYPKEFPPMTQPYIGCRRVQRPRKRHCDHSHRQRRSKIHPNGIPTNSRQLLHTKDPRHEAERNKEGRKPGEASDVSSVVDGAAGVVDGHDGGDDGGEAVNAHLVFF